MSSSSQMAAAPNSVVNTVSNSAGGQFKSNVTDPVGFGPWLNQVSFVGCWCAALPPASQGRFAWYFWQGGY